MDTVSPEEKLKQSEQLLYLAQIRFSGLLRSLPVGVAIVGSNGAIEVVNPAVAEILGYQDRGLLVGKDVAELVRKTPWDNNSNLQEWFSNNPGLTVELDGITADEELVPIDFSVHQFDSDTNERLVVVIADVTERFLANKLKHDFFQMINHDIRSPLASVMMFLETLASNHEGLGTLTDMGRERLSIAERNINRILQMAQQLLEIDKLETGSTNLNLVKIGVPLLLCNSAELMKEAAANKNIQIEVESVPAEIEGDRERLEQVLVNLLTNAINYSADGLPITLSSRRAGAMIRIEVCDRGPGLSAAEKPFVFDKFRRGAQSKSGGFGLGLAICREIVRQHGGRIGCDDAPGGGTIFWFEVAEVLT